MATGSKGWDIELSGVWSGDQHIQRHIHEGVRGGNFGGEGDFGDAVRWRGEGFRDLSRLGLKVCLMRRGFRWCLSVGLGSSSPSSEVEAAWPNVLGVFDRFTS